MSDFQEEWSTYCDRHGVPDRLELMLCDMNAVLRGKWLPGSEISKLMKGGVRLPMSTYAPNIFGEEVPASGLGIAVGDPDGYMVPVRGSLKQVAWSKDGTAQLLVEMTDNAGRQSEISSRHVLTKTLSRLKDRNLFPVVATELEFYIVKARENSDLAPQPPERLPRAQNYDLEVLARKEPILSDILDCAKALGLPTDTLIAEYGPGQFEINFHHTNDVLAAAEIALLFRRMVRGVAANHECEATFMAKPYADHPGNGMHAHVSILDGTGQNIFSAKPKEDLSDNLKRAIAGLLYSMRDLQAIFAPHMNSYRRFQPNSFAPATPDWGFDNRSAAVRIPETHGAAARFEHRISGADVNPYLALAGILGGVEFGLSNTLDLPEPIADDGTSVHQPLDYDWMRAVERFGSSDIAQDIFGAEFRDIYTAVRRDEIAQLMSEITAAEYRTYLSRM